MDERTGTMAQACEALTEKEKQTLRLLLVGHDAKSIAQALGLSVHTINERLRDARRKLSVGSSKEAARLLRASEGAAPRNLGDVSFGDAAAATSPQMVGMPAEGPPTHRATRAIGGVVMLSALAASIALLASSQLNPSGRAAPSAPAAAQPAEAPAETEVTSTARAWLELVDASNWSTSYAATAPSFRQLNTLGAWQRASERARVPLGAVVTRTLASEQDIPAPPNGYHIVRFHTDFASRRGATETVSLDQVAGVWRVVGVYVGQRVP